MDPSAWEVIKIETYGAREFREVWEHSWRTRSESETVADTMRRCVDACKQAEVPVLRAFLDAKRAIEEEEFQEVMRPFYDEVSR